MNEFGIYIHWPFCQSKCPYCDFNSHVAKQKIDESVFTNAFVRELNFYEKFIEGKKLKTIFFGGGTPSLMKAKSVSVLLEAINKKYAITENTEITLEANPSSVEAGRFQGYRQAGVNRVSIGVQSLIDSELKMLGRLHTAGEALGAIELANKIFKNFSFDLIYARPNQTAKQWRAELEQALKLGAEHLSLYQLTIEPNTPFFNLQEAGKLKLPSDELAADLYLLTYELTKARGLENYEISNYAVKGRESKHNLLYWRAKDWLGLGPGAHSRLTKNKSRYAIENIASPNQWLNKVKTKCNGATSQTILSKKQSRREFFLMAMRLQEGIKLKNCTELNKEKIKEFIQLKLLKKTKTHLCVTQNGRLLLNSLLGELVV